LFLSNSCTDSGKGYPKDTATSVALMTNKDGSFRSLSDIADFVYNDLREIHGPKGIEIIEDVKGKILPVFKLKLKLFLCKYPKTFNLI
jgi:hypothetical protein